MEKLVIIFVLFCASLAPGLADTNYPYPYEDGAYNGMMSTFFQSWSGECLAGAGGQVGTCMSKSECKKEGGVHGPGSGCGFFGVCCIVQKRCGARLTRKVTYLENLGNGFDYRPNRYDHTCSYTVIASSPRVCQVRLDFETFSLAPPDSEDRICRLDRIDFGDVTLCGENSGQHVYLPLNYTNGKRQLDFSFHLANRDDENHPGLTHGQPQWRIRVTQLECPDRIASRFRHSHGYEKNNVDDAFWIAPPGCLQYYPQREGEFSSFNLQTSGDQGQYLADLNYAICFRREDNTDHLELNTRVFDLARLPTGDPPPVDPKEPGFDDECFEREGTGGFPDDYLEVPAGEFELNSFSRVCGKVEAPGVINSRTPGPLYLLFHSGTLPIGGRGFRFRYAIRNTR